MRSKTVGMALALALAAATLYAQGTGTGRMPWGTSQSDSTAGTGLMQAGMSKGMMRGMRQDTSRPETASGMMKMTGAKAGAGTRKMRMSMAEPSSPTGMMGPLHGSVRALVRPSNWLTKVNLTEEQAARLETIRADFLKRRVDSKADLEKARIDLELLLRKNAEAGAVEPLVRDYYASRAAMEVDAYRTLQRVRGLLTPQQRKTLDLALKTPGCADCKGNTRGNGKRTAIR